MSGFLFVRFQISRAIFVKAAVIGHCSSILANHSAFKNAAEADKAAIYYLVFAPKL